jgi:uracil-DNA glycosylase family 4
MSKQSNFQRLVEEVRACRLCPRMADSARVLSNAAGNLQAAVMFVGEAPGRLGADQTEIPFHGDTAGHNFEAMLEFVGLSRDEIYVTNCVLCNPRNQLGHNATPLPSEINNCGGFLRRQIELVNPRIVVALGATALKALGELEPHHMSLREHVRTARAWLGRLLIPLYHPGQRAMVHRSHANQRSDYQFVAETLRQLSGRGKRSATATRGDVLAACRFIVQKRGEVSYFELHKLAYLAEYVHVKTTGQRMTRAFFIRQKDGPYCVDLSLARLKRADADLTVVSRGNKLMISLGRHGGPDLFDEEIALDDSLRQTLEEVLNRYHYPNDADLKRAVYLTAPMRMMLRRERREGVNLYNAPIEFLGA